VARAYMQYAGVAQSPLRGRITRPGSALQPQSTQSLSFFFFFLFSPSRSRDVLSSSRSCLHALSLSLWLPLSSVSPCVSRYLARQCATTLQHRVPSIAHQRTVNAHSATNGTIRALQHAAAPAFQHTAQSVPPPAAPGATTSRDRRHTDRTPTICATARPSSYAPSRSLRRQTLHLAHIFDEVIDEHRPRAVVVVVAEVGLNVIGEGEEHIPHVLRHRAHTLLL